jgi:hypothetical protein
MQGIQLPSSLAAASLAAIVSVAALSSAAIDGPQ